MSKYLICVASAMLAIVFGTAAPLIGQEPRAAAATAVEYLDQGWTEAERQGWYQTSQGSRLLPLAWILALEQKDATDKFLSEANIRGFGYLSNPADNNGLPLGFAVDSGPSPDGSVEPWAGMTCAACHTVEMTYQGRRLRVDGAAALADFQTFMEDLLAALRETRKDGGKFDRFAAALLGPNASQDGEDKLEAELDQQIRWYVRLEKKNESPVRYGHGRLDAQGHILNKLSLIVGAPDQITNWPADAPASYPFLWNTPQHDFVQWNGIAPQKRADPEMGVSYSLGALLRNITEVAGVFAAIDMSQGAGAPQGPGDPGDPVYPSSARLRSLVGLEELVKRLKSPRWPDHVFPAIDSALAGRGEQIYETNCATCHEVLDPATELERDIKAVMTPLADAGTDIWLACNTYLHESKSGALVGAKVPTQPGRTTQEPLKEADKTNRLLRVVARGMALGANVQNPDVSNLGGLYEERDQNITLNEPDAELSSAEKERRAAECLAQNNRILAYKARPLNGIWATAPYLHNGSVPTLYDLLLPARDRPRTFTAGGVEFDPVKVGFKSGPGDGPFEFRVLGEDGKTIPGNGNSGHDYGVDLNAEDRKAVVEYLKKL